MERSLRNRAHWRSLLILATAAAAPGAAFAADNGFYLGLASSEVSSDYAASSISASGADDDRGLKAIVGFRPLDSFAIEANYVDMVNVLDEVKLAGATRISLQEWDRSVE